MSASSLAVVLGVASTAFALVAAFFAVRADSAARSARAVADRRWDDMVRPQPRLTFVGPPSNGQSIELEVENPGGTLVAGAVIAEYGDDLFAGELRLPDHAPPQRILMPQVMKAWQRAKQPAFLMVAGRDISGRWWDCLNGARVIKDPRRWVETHLKDLRLQGAISFPELSGAPNSRR